MLHPTNVTVVAGRATTFSAAAIGEPLPILEWRFNGANISGQVSSWYTQYNNGTSFLHLYSLQPSNAGEYTFVASNVFPPSGLLKYVTRSAVVNPVGADELAVYEKGVLLDASKL